MREKKIRNNFKYAFCGIISSIKSERNMKIHITAMVLVIIAGCILKISKFEWMICTILFAMVIGAEMINTAIENTVNIAMPNKDEKAKIAKDVAAGAVLVNAIASAIIGFVIFIPKIIDIM